MNSPSGNNFEFIDLSQFLKGSLLLEPYKETIGHFYGEQLQIAVDLWRQGRIEEALPIFDDVYEIYPNFFIHKFIRISLRINDTDPEEILSELAELPYNDFVANLDKFLYHVTKAFAHFKLFDLDDCIESCKKSLHYIIDFTPIYLLLADSLIIRYHFSESIKYYKTVIKLGDYKSDSAKANLAYAYLQMKKTRKSSRLFQQVVDKFPDNYKIQYNMALCYVRNRNYTKAHKYLDIVETLNAEFSGLHLTRGGIYLKQKKQAEAIHSLKQAALLGSTQASNLLEKLSK